MPKKWTKEQLSHLEITGECIAVIQDESWAKAQVKNLEVFLQLHAEYGAHLTKKKQEKDNVKA